MNNLRILVYSNPLVVDKISKRFLYWRDSGFIFTKNLIKTFPSSCRFYWVVPDKLRNDDCDWFLSANSNIELVYYPYSTSIHQNRYIFCADVLTKEFPYTKDIDVIINNQPEVSMNLWSWAYNQRRELPILLSFFHWIDCEKSRKFAEILGGYFWREYDGSLASDAIYLHGKYGTKLFKDEIARFGLDDSKIAYKTFFPPATKFGTDPLALPENKKIILFNHRLNNTTNWKELVEKLKDLYETRKDFVLWMTDENRNLVNSSMLSDLPFIINKEVKDKNYGFLISNSHFSICNHKGYSTWNMAVLDAIVNDTFTLVPGYEDDVYVKMFGQIGNDVHMYHHGYDLLDRIVDLLDTPKEELLRRCNILKRHICQLDRKLLKIRDDIDELIDKRLDKSYPKKYLDVQQEIVRSGRLSKRDWVNKFWSFHTNSNFQFIRWFLLRDGILDDTSQSETVYYVKG